jgi:hypothetical protein
MPATVLGGLVGILVAWAMFYGASNYAGTGLALGLLLLIFAIYLDVIQVLPILFNASTMLFRSLPPLRWSSSKLIGWNSVWQLQLAEFISQPLLGRSCG